MVVLFFSRVDQFHPPATLPRALTLSQSHQPATRSQFESVSFFAASPPPLLTFLISFVFASKSIVFFTPAHCTKLTDCECAQRSRAWRMSAAVAVAAPKPAVIAFPSNPPVLPPLPPPPSAVAPAATIASSPVASSKSTATSLLSAAASVSPVDRYSACLLLSGVGDAIGFYHGSWEFNTSAPAIHSELMAITKQSGCLALNLKLPDWPVSDDTVLHMATARGFVDTGTDAKAKPAASTPAASNPADAIVVSDAFRARCKRIAGLYAVAMRDMDGRAVGQSTIVGMIRIGNDGTGWDRDFNRPLSQSAISGAVANDPQSLAAGDQSGGGCGVAMRSMAIGLAYPHWNDRALLCAYAIQTGRITHRHPTGFLGGAASAAFTAFALRFNATPPAAPPPVRWGSILVNEILPECERVIRVMYPARTANATATATASGASASANANGDAAVAADADSVGSDLISRFDYFRKSWIKYLTDRNIYFPNYRFSDWESKSTATAAVAATATATAAEPIPSFPSSYGAAERDEYFRALSFSGWAGSSGHDAVIIAYDSFLSALRWLHPTPPNAASGAESKAAAAPNYSAAYEQLILHSALHGGDSDTTGCIALSWWGAAFGLNGVPNGHIASLEYRHKLSRIGRDLFDAWKDRTAW